jgi:hypothetical protein
MVLCLKLLSLELDVVPIVAVPPATRMPCFDPLSLFSVKVATPLYWAMA